MLYYNRQMCRTIFCPGITNNSTIHLRVNIWSVVEYPFLKPAWASLISWFESIKTASLSFITCSPCSPWWPFPYLVGVGLVLLLHSFRSRATSWVTPTPAMSSFICWCHVFLGRLVVWYLVLPAPSLCG